MQFTSLVSISLLALVSLPNIAASEKLDPFWQDRREQFNAISDAACAGDADALQDLMAAVYRDDDPVAKNDLAWLYATSSCSFSHDRMDVAVDLIKQSADAGYPPALNNYGNRLMHGDGVPKDASNAVVYLLAAVAAGYASAAIDAGIYHVEGEHIPQNLEVAREFLEAAIELDADASEIDKLRSKLQKAEPTTPPPDKYSWSVENGEAGWTLTSNNEPVARVFFSLNEYSLLYGFGLRRYSPDPIEFFVSATVELERGSTFQIPIGDCYGYDCVDVVDDGPQNAYEIYIPIVKQDEYSILNVLTRGKDIIFRYQTEESAKSGELRTMRLPLKGAQAAIEQIIAMAENPPSSGGTTVADNSGVETSTDSPAAPTTGGSGKSYVVNETRHNDMFCDAAELDAYPAQINAPEMANEKKYTETDAYTKKHINPVTTNFAGRGTTVWDGLIGETILYSNGAVVALGEVIEGQTISHGPRWEGSWEHKDGLGLMMRLKSVKKLSWGHEYFECSHGFLTAGRETGNRPTTDNDGNPIMKRAVWRGCTLKIHCKRWTDEHPEKKPRHGKSGAADHGRLVEWSTAQIPWQELRWDRDY